MLKRNPDTQIEAWNDLKEGKLTDRQKAVFDEITASYHEGRTLFEISENLDKPVNEISGRVTELAGRGLIRDSGSRRENPKSGKKGVVWKVSYLGYDKSLPT